jgi:hypothetical protein
MSDRKPSVLADPGYYYLEVVVDTDGNICDDDFFEVSAVYIDSTLKSKYARGTSKWNTLLWNCSAHRKNVGLRKADPKSMFEVCWLQFNTIDELNLFAGTNFTQAPNEGK